MADGALLPDLLLCWPFCQENCRSAVMAFCQQRTTADSNRENAKNQQEQNKMNLNKLMKT
jgi:hypothetical protein